MSQLAMRTRAGIFAPVALVVSLFIGLFPALSATALGTLDQQATGSSTRWYYIMNNVPLAQVFTAGASGQLDRISIDAYSFQSATTAPLVASIYAVDGSGFPTGNSLSSASVSQTLIPGTVSTVVFDFTSPVTVASGTAYAIVFSTTGSGEYHFENATTVPAGAKGVKPGSGNVGWQNYIDTGVTPNQTSFRFATYVTAVPSPSPSASTSVISDPNLANTGIQETDVFPLMSSGLMLLLAGLVMLLLGRKTATHN
ncbi:hypothetical protein [Aurantimicrobium minutum]|uniref:hypothetical protein n=1 Tax=Aurantimicrobium minutum TaxID=708131 RepID=UPI002473FA46|nr:hypothetical protein [Aurantimicrobium minutum]